MGEPGCGKSVLGLTFPDVHVMDCDQNLDGPERILRVEKKLKLDYTYDSIRQDDAGQPIDIEKCFDRLCDKLQLFNVDKAYQSRRTIFLDSLSHVNEFIIRKILKLKNKESMEINNWTDFSSFAYSLLIARLERPGKTIICSCHLEKIYETDQKDLMKKNLIQQNPLFSGRVGDSLSAFFTDVWLLSKEPGLGNKIIYKLQTNRTPKCIVLKNSLGLPNEIDVTDGFKVLEPYMKGRI